MANEETGKDGCTIRILLSMKVRLGSYQKGHEHGIKQNVRQKPNMLQAQTKFK